MILSEDLVATLFGVLDRNTKVLDLVADHMIRSGRPGATMPPLPSSTVQKADDGTTPMTETRKQTGKLTKRFRGRARTTSHKDANELHYRVSLMSSNGFCHKNTLQKNVRKHVNKMMGRTHSDKVEPAPEETALKYKHTGKNEDGPSMDLFRADFSKRFPEKSPWNICLAEIFANDYVKSGLPFSQLKDVSHYFITYL